MKQTNKTGWTRLMALVLTLALLLAGCGGPAEDSSGNSEDTSTENTGNADDSGSGSGFEIGGDTGGTQEEPVSEEERELLNRMGVSMGEKLDLSEDDAREINRAVAGMQTAYVAGPYGSDPLVKDRDWSVYTSPLATNNMSRREAEFTNRLDELAMKYLSTSAYSGVRKAYSSSSRVYYATDYINYSDLGLTDEKAHSLYFWFRFTHPQYYFLTNSFAAGYGKACGFLYDFATDGKERAAITNELFDKLEGWVQEVESKSSTTYQKELYASNLICETVTYNYDALEDGHDYEMSVCQSLYSTVMLEDTVCAGYSLAFTAMMGALGVETTAGLSDAHAWNVVHFDDGNYYCVDVCWNDRDGKTPPYYNKYINMGEEDLWETTSRGESHTYGEDLAAWIPEVAQKSYIPTDEDTGSGTDTETNTSKVAAPANPRATTSEKSDDKVLLEWDPVAGASVYDTCAFTDSTCTEIIEGTLYTDPADEGAYTYWSSLKAGRTYYFGVRAGKEAGGETVYSDWVNITYTHPAEEDTDADKLAAPANVKAVPSEDAEDKVLVSWDPVAGATVYESCAYTDSSYTKIWEGTSYTGAADEGAYTYWTSLTDGETYYFGVRAGKEVDGETVYSDWANISYTHLAEGDTDTDKLAAPTNIDVPFIANVTIQLTWDPVPDATGYEVRIYKDADHSGEPETEECPSTQLWKSGVSKGKTLYLTIRAVKEADGETVYSDWVDFTYTHNKPD